MLEEEREMAEKAAMLNTPSAVGAKEIEGVDGVDGCEDGADGREEEDDEDVVSKDGDKAAAD